MATKKIAVTRVIPDAGLALLAGAGTTGEIMLEVWPDALPPSPDELRSLLAGASGAITLVTDRIDATVLDREPGLRVVSNLAVGYDNINVGDATARGVAICNTPGVLTETTADFAFALLMSAARRVVEGADYVREGKWQTWDPTLFLGQDVHHATLGIIGFGRIGKEMAKRGRGFDMRILAFDSYRDESAAAELGVEFVDLNTLLAASDFITLHCALTPETRHLIGAEQLSKMKSTAVLINAARGPVVDTDALYDALQADQIFRAALDVTDPEPIPARHPIIALSNCLIVPHIASGSVATRNKMSTLAAQNCLAVIRGETPPHCVNPEVLARVSA